MNNPNGAARMLDLAASLETMRPLFSALETELAEEARVSAADDERDTGERAPVDTIVNQALDGWRRALRIAQEVC